MLAAALDAVRAVVGDTPAWVVGGAVRDELLGRDTADLDVVLAPEAVRPVARRLARHLGGGRNALSEEFGGIRLHGPSWHVDLLPLRDGSLQADLALRDFTVNAMARPVAGGARVDPFGGAEDLAAGRLRMVGARAFADDPLRTVRLARLGCELGLTPEPATLAAARASAPGAARVAQERVWAELKRILLAEDVVGGFALLRAAGLYPAILPELEATVGMAQNRFHHLDVHDHTLETVRLAGAVAADPAEHVGPELAGPVAAVLAQPLADELDRAGGLRVAALLHDIAKPPTRGELADGRVTFIGHDRVGATMAREVLGRLKASQRLRGHAALLTACHLDLGFLVHEDPLRRRSVHRVLQHSAPSPVDSILLTVCDRLATRGDNAGPAIAAHLALARRVLPDALAWQAGPPPDPLVRGDVLAAALGIAPGPGLGPLLQEIATARWCGEIARSDEALALARAQLDAGT